MLEEMYEHPNKIAWRTFQDEIDQHGFQMKISDRVLDISEIGVLIYSVDKTTVKYNKRSYSNNHPYVAPERVAELEDIIFKYCGWGAQGSTRLLEPLKKWKARHLQSSHYPDVCKEAEG